MSNLRLNQKGVYRGVDQVCSEEVSGGYLDWNCGGCRGGFSWVLCRGRAVPMNDEAIKRLARYIHTICTQELWQDALVKIESILKEVASGKHD